MPDEVRATAVFYEPTPIMEFGYMLAKTNVQVSEYAFIDLGSGKGRCLLLAAYFPFRRIIGVEIASNMHQIAQQNIQDFGGRKECENIVSVCQDAGTFEFPDDPLVLFLFNPFSAEVISKVLDNLRCTYENNPRHMLVVFANLKHQQVFEGVDFLSLTRTELDGWYSVFETQG